jgi:hypothetical protein
MPIDLDELLRRARPTPEGELLLPEVEQRWREGRTRFVPPEEVFDPSRFGVEVIEEGAAKDFVVRHHYSGSYPAARLRVGLFERQPFLRPRLVGVAVFSVPMQRAAVPAYAPALAPSAGVELGRFVLLDRVAFNAESWFLARAFAALSSELDEVEMVLSYSDPVPRRTATGRLVMPGHVGQIYQAFNGRFVGRSSPRSLWLDRAGRVVSERALSKIRNEERGAAYATRLLLDAGAPRPRANEGPAAWVTRALQEGPFRRVRHPGNLVYVWALGGKPARRAVELGFPPALPYVRKPGTKKQHRGT